MLKQAYYVAAATLLLSVLCAEASRRLGRVSRGGGRLVQVEAVTGAVVHGEGPHWAAPFVYFVDISSSALHRLDTESGQVSNWTVAGGGAVSLAAPLDAEPHRRLVLSRDRQLVEFDAAGDGAVVAVLADADAGRPGNRFNDGKVDPSGRLWAGTMGPEEPGTGVVPKQGSLYLLGSDGLDSKVSGVDVSNGLAWNANATLMYYVDTGTGRVDVFDYDDATAAISNRRVAADLRNESCLPDGMAMDAEGMVWVACWGGWQVVRVDVGGGGRVVARVALPAQYVTSVAWGGATLDQLFVSTSRRDLDAAHRQQQPLAGALFRVTGLGVRGAPAHNLAWPLKPLPSKP